MNRYSKRLDRASEQLEASNLQSHTTNWLGRIRQHGLALVFLYAVTACAYPWWFASGGPGYDDLSRLNGPQRMFLGWAFRHGHLPLWNPFSFGGQPFLSAGQSGPLYLPNIVFVLFPILAAFKFSYIFHALLAATGCYFIAWHLTRRRLAGIVAAVCFTTSGFLIGHQIHTQMYDAMSWLPLLFYLLLKVFADRRIRWLVALGCSGALEIYAGHPQITFFELLFLGVTAVVMIVLLPNRTSLQAGLRLLFAGVIAAGLSAAQWLPTLGLVFYSDRQKLPAWYLLHLSLPWNGFIQFLTPFTAGGGYTGVPFTVDKFSNLFGVQTFWELTPYAGITCLILAVTGAVAWFRRHPAIPAVAVAAVLSSSLCIGVTSPFRNVLVGFPGFDLFRVPARYVGLVDFSIAILAGVGIAAVAEAVTQRRRLSLLLTVATGMLCVVLLISSRISGVLRTDPLVTTLVPCGLALLVPTIMWIAFGYPRKQLNLATRPDGQSIRARWASVAVAGIVMLDMTSQAAALTPFIRVQKPSYTNPGSVTRFLKSHLTSTGSPLQRIVSFPDAPLAYDEAAAVQIPSLDGYDSLEPQWYADQLDLTWSPLGLLSEPRTLLDAYDVKYLVTANDDPPTWSTQKDQTTTYTHVFPHIPNGSVSLDIQLQSNESDSTTSQPLLSVTLQSGTHTVTELLQGTPNQAFMIPLPADWPVQAPVTITAHCESWETSFWLDGLIWMTPGTKSIPPFEVHTLLYPESLQPVVVTSTSTIWENPDVTSSAWLTTTPSNPLLNRDGTVTAQSIEPNRQVWQTNAKSTSELFISQTFDPGWRASVDGHPVAVDRVGSLYGSMLTGVSIPKGTHEVVLTYHPTSFYSGLLIVGLTILVLLCVLGGRRRAGRSRRSQNQRSQPSSQ